MHAWNDSFVRIIFGAQSENFDVVFRFLIIVYEKEDPVIVQIY